MKCCQRCARHLPQRFTQDFAPNLLCSFKSILHIISSPYVIFVVKYLNLKNAVYFLWSKIAAQNVAIQLPVFFFIFFYQILYALKASHFVSTHIKQYSFFYFSCCISSWLHTSSSSPYTSPWNVTTPTPWNDATTPWSSSAPWSLTISSSTSWSNATTRRNTTTSWSTTPWGPTR